ncbi:MAG: glucose-6-phosphate isomerase [Rubricoccaceae bacterium]
MLHQLDALRSSYDPATGVLHGAEVLERRLSDLRGTFADTAAYEQALVESDPVVYRVSSVTPAEGDGQLHYGIGTLMPGRVGDEFYMTKGHFHTWRPAAEFYFGLSGHGAMLLEDEATGESRTVELAANSAVYVPGHTAHRTINTGDEPLIYIGVYPAQAGHDYGVIAERNFRQLVVATDSGPKVLGRADYLSTLTPA